MKRPPIAWVNCITLASIHVAALVTIFLVPFRWEYLAAMAGLHAAATVAVTGMHRGMAHRAIRMPHWLETYCAFMNAGMVMGGPLTWVGRHRFHHQVADTPRDVHSPFAPEESFWHGHIGWILRNSDDETRYMETTKDLQDNRALVWIERARAVPAVLLLAAFCLVAGFPAALWCFVVTVVFTFHTTQAINSIGHTRWFGSRSYDTVDQSRNVWWMCLISMGESWHNNHHKFPMAANLGQRWFELDPGFRVWWILSKLGLVRIARVQAFVPAGEGGQAGRTQAVLDPEPAHRS